MSQTIIPWQMKDADGNLLSPNVWTNTIYDADGNLISGIATEREVGDAYDSSKTYPTYSPYCIHNNKLYKYSGASGTTTTGTWDSTKWTETDVAGELSTLNSNLAKKLYEKTYTNTTQTWQTILGDFYTNTADIISALSDENLNRLKVRSGNLVFSLTYVGSGAYHFTASSVSGSGINLYGLMLSSTSYYVNEAMTSSLSFSNYSGNAIGSARTLQLYLA